MEKIQADMYFDVASIFVQKRKTGLFIHGLLYFLHLVLPPPPPPPPHPHYVRMIKGLLHVEGIQVKIACK